MRAKEFIIENEAETPELLLQIINNNKNYFNLLMQFEGALKGHQAQTNFLIQIFKKYYEAIQKLNNSESGKLLENLKLILDKVSRANPRETMGQVYNIAAVSFVKQILTPELERIQYLNYNLKNIIMDNIL